MLVRLSTIRSVSRISYVAVRSTVSGSFSKRERAEEEQAVRRHEADMLRILHEKMEKMEKDVKEDKAKDAEKDRAEAEQQVCYVILISCF